MSTIARTFKITYPPMKGKDVEEWQELIRGVAHSWGIYLPIKTDGVYGMSTRSFGKMVCFGLGFTHEQLEDGITPWIRSLTRNSDIRPDSMDERKMDEARKDYRADLRQKFKADASSDVAAPIGKIITMTWGYHKGVHDGIDLICGPRAPIRAICDGLVFDVRAGGWWGNSPSGQVWKGDGIIQIECLTDDGPFKKGMHIGYGHAEGADVKVGQRVEAGARLGEAGLAVAWHIHLMANYGNTRKGVGQFDPRQLVDFSLKNG